MARTTWLVSTYLHSISQLLKITPAFGYWLNLGQYYHLRMSCKLRLAVCKYTSRRQARSQPRGPGAKTISRGLADVRIHIHIVGSLLIRRFDCMQWKQLRQDYTLDYFNGFSVFKRTVILRCQCFFPRGSKIFPGVALPPCLPLGYGPAPKN
jgi:hypothetical protein